MKKKLIKPTVKEDLAITKAARSDPDSRPLTEKEWKRIKPTLVRGRGRPPGSGSKEQITLRIDKETLNFYRSKGEGWQTFINLVLGELKRESKSIKTIERRLNQGKLMYAWFSGKCVQISYALNPNKKGAAAPWSYRRTTLLSVAVSTEDAQKSQEVGEDVVDTEVDT